MPDLPKHHGMIGSSPLARSIEGILSELDDPKITNKVSNIIFNVRGYTHDLRNIYLADNIHKIKNFPNKVRLLARESCMVRLESLKTVFPEVLYTHVRNFIVTEFRPNRFPTKDQLLKD